MFRGWQAEAAYLCIHLESFHKPKHRAKLARAVGILEDLDGFVQEHRRCGELTNGTSTARPELVWINCSCGGYIAKPIAPTQDDPE